MATAANSAAGYEGSAGAGGKFRKRMFRKTQTTPYDLPAAALRPAQAAAAAAEKNGWVSKFVDPASKLITAGAHKLFSSVFRKRLLPPPPPPPPQHPPEENTEAREMHSEAATVVVPYGPKKPIICGGNDPVRISNSNGVAELEDLLKQKTFTRSEIDHLTGLLLSRTSDNSAGAEKRSEPNFVEPHAGHSRNENCTYFLVHENGIEHVVPGAISMPAMRSKVLEEDVASAAELAKAYMGSRPRKVSPSVLGLQNRMPRQDLSAFNNAQFKPRSPATFLLQKPVSDVGTSENGLTPRFRGKSAIYSMARTPYSRIHPTAAFKAAETAVDARGGSFSNHNAAENDQLNGSKKQVLKRRSSVLENDIGSVGPIRRIRQKPNLLHPKILSLPASGGSRATHVSGAFSDAAELPSSSNWNSHSHSHSKSVANNSMPSTSSGCVPSQSIETAQKIFQQLDKFIPKGKSLEWKLDIGGGSPSKMTPAMLGGQARRSMETVDSLKFLQSSDDSKKENGLLKSVDAHDPPPKRSLMVEEASLKKLEAPSNNLAPRVGTEVRLSTSHSSQNTQVMDLTSKSGSDHRPKKRGFQMSAHEDYLDLDDDVHMNGVASTPLSEGVENTELSRKSAAITTTPPQDEAIAVEKPAVPEQKPSTDSLLSMKESESLSNGLATAGNATGFTFSVAPSSSPATSLGMQSAVTAPSSTSVFDKVVAQNESKNAVPVFSIKSEKLPPLTFSTTSSVLEPAVQKDTKLELPYSANDTVAKEIGPSENEKKSTEEASPVTSSAKDIFSFGSPANNVTFNNGLPNTVPSIPTAPTPVLFTSTSSSSQSLVPTTSSVSVPPPFTGGFSLSNGFAASVSTFAMAAGTMGSTGIASSTQPLNSAITPSVSSGPVFQFGTFTATSAASGGSENSGAKLPETALGNTTSPFAKSSATPTGGSGIFGFNASTSKNTGGEGQTTVAATTTGSIFGFQAVSSSTASVSTSTPSFPSQFPSSASSPVFGLSGATSVGSGAPVFSSNAFSSGSASASTSLGASSTSSPVTASSGPASSLFGSGWQPSKPTIPALGSTSPSTAFFFGPSASGPSADGNKTIPIVFESSTSAAPAVFGSSTSGSAAAGNTAPAVFGSSTTGSSAASNSTPFLFGATNSSAPPLSIFSFSSAGPTPASSQPVFGNTSTPAFSFGLTPTPTSTGNNDQMSMEDSMAEDSMQPTTPVFGQPPASAPSTEFVFGGSTPSPSFGGAAPTPGGSPFQFGSQQNQMGAQCLSPFQPSGSVEFNAGGAGSFSLGTGGDKSNRKIVKVKNRLRRK